MRRHPDDPRRFARPPGDYVIQMSEDQPPEVARYIDIGWVLIGAPEALGDADLYRIGPMIEIDRRTLSCWSLPG